MSGPWKQISRQRMFVALIGLTSALAALSIYTQQGAPFSHPTFSQGAPRLL